jgi:hypothetical protein
MKGYRLKGSQYVKDDAAPQSDQARNPRSLFYQPRLGPRCACRPGQQRDNCAACEGTGWLIDFAAIRARNAS